MVFFKKYHRKYPDIRWNYKAVSIRIGNMEIIYYELISKGKKSNGVEIYQGKNYDSSSFLGSYSRRYSLKEVPLKYKDVVKILKRKHGKIKWSRKRHINLENILI